MNKVLIVVDVQEDFTRGALRNEDAIAALPKIHDIDEFARNNDMEVFYTMDTHGDDYLNTQEGRNLPVPHCIHMTEGWKVCPEAIIDDKLVKVIRKGTFGFPHWDVFPIVGGADEVWICGFCTDICVSANFQIIKATYPEVPIVVIDDACAGVTPTAHKAALKVMQSCQARVVKWDKLKKENANEA